MRDYYADAVKSDPDGETCAHCGNKNDFYDDCGWFYVADYRDGITRDAKGLIDRKVHPSKPCCEACYYGPVGQSHTKVHGVGDR